MFGEVLRGEPSEIIVKTARQVAPDLIVLGIHNEEGLAAFLSTAPSSRSPAARLCRCYWSENRAAAVASLQESAGP